MNSIIDHFLQNQTCATICCADKKGKPYCFSCFYVFNSEEGLLYFKSSTDSHHAWLIKENPFVAGTVLPDKLNKLNIEGLQFEAMVLDVNDPVVIKDPGYYHRKNPIALAIPGDVWTIQLNNIKMTDSTIIFGKKISWNRSDEEMILLKNK